jgi:hypothetical protein
MVDNTIHTDQHHQDIYEMLGAYALDAVTDEERVRIEEHLSACPVCAQELVYLTEATSALPLSVDEYEPSPQLRNRIAAIGQTPQQHTRPAEALSPPPVDFNERRQSRQSQDGSDRGPARIWTIAPWTAAAILLIAVVGLVAWNVQLQSELEDRPTLETVSVSTTGAEGVQADLLFFTDQEIVVLDVRGLPQRQEDEIYQVWLIQDGQPIPAGVFDEPADLIAISADIGQYQAVGVTIEPGPIGSPQPTTEPILVSEIT